MVVEEEQSITFTTSPRRNGNETKQSLRTRTRNYNSPWSCPRMKKKQKWWPCHSRIASTKLRHTYLNKFQQSQEAPYPNSPNSNRQARRVLGRSLIWSCQIPTRRSELAVTWRLSSTPILVLTPTVWRCRYQKLWSSNMKGRNKNLVGRKQPRISEWGGSNSILSNQTSGL